MNLKIYYLNNKMQKILFSCIFSTIFSYPFILNIQDNNEINYIMNYDMNYIMNYYDIDTDTNYAINNNYDMKYEICNTQGIFLLNYFNFDIKQNNIEIKLNGDLKQSIDSGTLKVNIKFQGITLYNKELDLCDNISEYQSCPIESGKKKYNIIKDLDNAKIPNGNYIIEIKGKTKSNIDIICLKIFYKK